MENEISHIRIQGNRIGIAGLDEILPAVADMGIEDERKLRDVLLERVKVRNYIPSHVERKYGDALLNVYYRYLGKEIVENDSVLTVRILGIGCTRCEKVRQATLSALNELGIPADVEQVTDPGEIAKYGVVAPPALVLNGKVYPASRLMNRENVKQLLKSEKIQDRMVEFRSPDE
jgi:hypothetical protein